MTGTWTQRFVLLAAIMLAPPALADQVWTDQSATKITSVTLYENGNPQAIFTLGLGYSCLFITNEVNGQALLSTVLAAYYSGRKVSVACYPETLSTGGLTVHRLHRIVLVP